MQWGMHPDSKCSSFAVSFNSMYKLEVTLYSLLDRRTDNRNCANWDRNRAFNSEIGHFTVCLHLGHIDESDLPSMAPAAICSYPLEACEFRRAALLDLNLEWSVLEAHVPRKVLTTGYLTLETVISPHTILTTKIIRFQSSRQRHYKVSLPLCKRMRPCHIFSSR